MKAEIHPKLNPVVFIDAATGSEIVTRSTMVGRETKEIDGITHYIVKLDVSSYSHPFWTGQTRARTKEGRVELFNRRFKKKKS